MNLMRMVSSFFVLAVFLSAGYAEDVKPSDPALMKVDFSYAFSTPHRMAVALPDSSNKTPVGFISGLFADVMDV